MNRLSTAIKATRQLGLRQVGLYGLYKIGLFTGYYRRITSKHPNSDWGGILDPALFALPAREDVLAFLGNEGLEALVATADEIVDGKTRLFGAAPVEILLTVPGPLLNWTAYESGNIRGLVDQLPIPDIKFLWEPARFGWAFTLGRAYHMTGDEKYAQAFWKYFEIFDHANPACLGPHWMNGQEVALRLMAFTWCGQVFDRASGSTLERKQRLANSVAEHAARIPPTLVYARSQNNNHILTEAAGLFTAGLALRDHPEASRWRGIGWRWLNQGLQSQIDSYGEYAQHSTNYHRLMLQVVLWANALVKKFDLRWPRPTMEAIRRSVHWMLSMLDAESGQCPNLGANDGAYLFQFSRLPFEDHRPVAHACALEFLDYGLPRGAWDELGLWFAVQAYGPKTLELPRYLGDQLYSRRSWAYLRTAQYTSRPSHADQLHFDLWWRGMNIARDAGTYLYNTPPPWDNSLVSAFFHNTVTVNGHDQMKRAGRFLYLDWVNAYCKTIPVESVQELQRLQGRYRGHNYRHTRIISVREADHWQVIDEILPFHMPWHTKPNSARLHWLLPDWEWDLKLSQQGLNLHLNSPHGPFTVAIQHTPFDDKGVFSLVRAGEILAGQAGSDPRRGWTSPTYGVKIPALSLSVMIENEGEITFNTEFIFPPGASEIKPGS